MKVGFAGDTHLGQTMSAAAKRHRFDVVDDLWVCDLVFITLDVEKPEDVKPVADLCHRLNVNVPEDVPFIIQSQVPPGFTRKINNSIRRPVYYQLDTIIVNKALERATYPERFIIGCPSKQTMLPPLYLDFLLKFGCTVYRMSYESAELAKQAINTMLAAQIATTNVLCDIAHLVEADWDDVETALRTDARIGKTAYVTPGQIGGHLVRDIRLLDKLSNDSLFPVLMRFIDD